MKRVGNFSLKKKKNEYEAKNEKDTEPKLWYSIGKLIPRTATENHCLQTLKKTVKKDVFVESRDNFPGIEWTS